MKRTVLVGLLGILLADGFAQKGKTFQGYLYNAEYQVYMRINLHEKDVLAEGQELFGRLPGYLGSKRDSRLWLITDAKMTGDKLAELSIINDYGSEDLTAKLSMENDSTYTLKQLQGSAIKIVVDQKWVKLPRQLLFKVKKR